MGLLALGSEGKTVAENLDLMKSQVEMIKFCNLHSSKLHLCQKYYDQSTLSRSRRYLLPAYMEMKYESQLPICQQQPCQKKNNILRIDVSFI